MATWESFWEKYFEYGVIKKLEMYKDAKNWKHYLIHTN